MRSFKALVCTAALSAMAFCLTGCSFSLAPTTDYVYENGDKYTAGDRVITDKIEKIDIDYMSGDIDLSTSSSNEISITETSEKQLDENRKVHTWVDGDTLRIRYCASAKRQDLYELNKHLEITIPEDLALKDFDTDVSSGDLNLAGIQAENVKIEASSGDIFLSCAADMIDLNASSGEITLDGQGEIKEIDVETSSGKISVNAEKAGKLTAKASSGEISVTSGDIKELSTESSSGDNEIRLEVAPGSADISTSSGKVDLYLPEKADLSADINTSSGDISYELPFSKSGERFVCGNGSNKLGISTSSGDISIYKID